MSEVSVNSIEPFFPQFDVASDHSDHHYAYTRHDLISSTAKKKIMSEWRILRKNLPESAIYVRAYESRIDLLRAVIVGPHGTPYEHGLFFFDIKFPDNYPNQPPQVHYISHGLRINPNLYENGYVCLSLLNTWRRKGVELWDPSRSTVLQVVVSIQGLVLNEKPMANESLLTFWIWLFGLRGMSRSYNDGAFVKTCRSMLFLLRRPPRNFEAFVGEHFRGRAIRILEACAEFVHYRCYDLASKKSMEELYPLLVNVFEANEAQLVKGVEKTRNMVKGYKREAKIEKEIDVELESRTNVKNSNPDFGIVVGFMVGLCCFCSSASFVSGSDCKLAEMTRLIPVFFFNPN